MAGFQEEVTRPLSVLDGLFTVAQTNCISAGGGPLLEWGERAHFEAKLGLDNEENYARIPCLNDVDLVDQIPPFSLVRYRCLVQDIFESEIFVSVVEEVDQQSGTGRLLSTKYREFVEPAEGHMIRETNR